MIVWFVILCVFNKKTEISVLTEYTGVACIQQGIQKSVIAREYIRS